MPKNNPDGALAVRAIVRSLTHPLAEEIQYPRHSMFIPISRGGTFVAAKLSREEVFHHVAEDRVHIEKGTVYKTPDDQSGQGHWRRGSGSGEDNREQSERRV
ncbi:hypothetical protein B0T24DRAFT_636165 [Lasiosphaeria ovina]|uniref:Uncharacterized protein n=1 Tax=Lasiosphaeria ovina TaxID=92902 RepID=A0AAE0N138_9PEZI|nr:hypothetical protein B0T24DRAFT_636165 [Lasiosphaeria ovina]